MARRLKRLRAALATVRADLELLLFRPRERHFFHIVSAAHDAERWIYRHLESIANQAYPADRVQHLIIDDESGDSTEAVVRLFMRRHPSRRVEYRKNAVRRGGCANYTRGFREAPAGSIVLQVDGDDWLPDRRVLAYLDMLYHDPELWMTFNTWRFPGGAASLNSARYPDSVIDTASYRTHGWVASHLHSFRKELFDHVRDESLIDPETGEFWRSSVDMSHYYPMLELSGRHARHVSRVTYVYNMNPESIINRDRARQQDAEKRIRALPHYARLSSLVPSRAGG